MFLTTIFQEEQEYAVGDKLRNFGLDYESESMRDKMADERRVPSMDGVDHKMTDQTVPVTDEIDGMY